MALEPSHAAYAKERLQRLAANVGIVLPAVENVAGSATWRCVGVVKSMIDPWHLAKVIAALFPQASVQARVSAAPGRTVEPWMAMPPPAGVRMLGRVDAVLTRDDVQRAIGNCLVIPLHQLPTA